MSEVACYTIAFADTHFEYLIESHKRLCGMLLVDFCRSRIEIELFSFLVFIGMLFKRDLHRFSIKLTKVHIFRVFLNIRNDFVCALNCLWVGRILQSRRNELCCFIFLKIRK